MSHIARTVRSSTPCRTVNDIPRYRKGPFTPDYFWSRVEKTDGCWYFLKARSGKRYPGRGFVRVSGGRRRPYQVAFELTNGLIPKGMVICHRCDNPSFCRPEHLFLGTQRDNLLDGAAKARAAGRKWRDNRGKRNPNYRHGNRTRKER